MAAAEARAAWQRTANRCFVQEDAKRAPKLACCPTSSTSKEVDVSPAPGTDGSVHPVMGFASLSGIPSGCTISPDARWWLQLQPNFYQKDLAYEHINASDTDVEIMKTNSEESASNFDGYYPQKEEKNMQIAACLKKDAGSMMQEAKLNYNENARGHKDMKEHCGITEKGLVGCSVPRQPDELCFDSESVWFGSGKTEPWWHMSDREELASFVAQKSLDLVANCDLPPTEKMHVRGDPLTHTGCIGEDMVSPVDSRSQSVSTSHLAVPVLDSSSLESMHGKSWASAEKVDNNRQLREAPGVVPTSEGDFGKAQLLEALCHSQTRAREAEMEAKLAKADKEHVLKLFLRQASELFVYKQWFRLLQLEAPNPCITNSNQPLFALFPTSFPSVHLKASKLRKRWLKASTRRKGKCARPRCDISKYAIAFALGLSLVGAGLLLGWTVGWMLPTL